MELYIELSRDEIREGLPYAIIAETASRAVWNTGRRKRLFKETFTPNQRDTCYRIIRQAHSWHLVKSCPDSVRLLPGTLLLWQKLGNFCASL